MKTRLLERLTDTELKIERTYRYEERLGILCGANEPTEEQKEIARREANLFGQEQQELFNQ